jgi:integrase
MTNNTAKHTANLWLHKATGQWCKKIGGDTRYFGTDPVKAEVRYKAFLEGPPKGTQVRDLLNSFHEIKRDALDNGEIDSGSYDCYVKVLDKVGKSLGKHREIGSLDVGNFGRLRDDLAKNGDKQAALTTLENRLTIARMLFRHAGEMGYRDLPYQRALKRPPAVAMRKERKARPKRWFTRDQIHAMLAAADPKLRSAILLALNTAMGAADIAEMPSSAIKGGWLNFPRVKTAIDRRCPLWQESIAAYVPLDWTVHQLNYYFNRLTSSLGITGGFYTFKRVFVTVGKRAGERAALKRIVGHVEDTDMTDRYDEGVDDEGADDQQLRAVTDFVRAWVFNSERADIVAE